MSGGWLTKVASYSRNGTLANPRFRRLPEHHAADTGQREYDRKDVGLRQSSVANLSKKAMSSSGSSQQSAILAQRSTRSLNSGSSIEIWNE